MKRRKFLRNIGAVSAAPILLNGLPVQSFATPGMLSMLNCDGIGDRVLVVLFMKGGNDGINTLVPINQYDTYVNHRPDIHLENSGANSIINLDSNLSIEDQIGLNPGMTSFKSMYDDGMANIVQSVGYANVNQSHFKSTDLWLTGGDSTPQNFNLTSGWMGRYMEHAFPGIAGNPSSQFPDPLGIQLGDTKPSIGFHDHASEYVGSNLGWQYPGDLSGLLSGLGTAPHATMMNTDFGKEIEYIMNVENNTNTYGNRISDVFNAGSNSGVTYPDSGLGYQLSSVARLLSGGSKTKIFLIHTYGFDTHADQVVAGQTHLGNHSEILKDVFDSIKVFHQDLANLGIEQKVITSTFSEFGRRVTQNGSLGTDHGLQAPMFLFGSSVNPGVIGTNVDLSVVTDSGNLVDPLQYDYRSVFKTLLQDWLAADNSIITDVGFDPVPKIPGLVNPSATVTTDCYISPVAPLPVTLKYFDVEKTPDLKVAINWTAEYERNFKVYEIERSEEGIRFEKIEEVSPMQNDDILKEYEHFDETPLAGTSYYRLKSVDRDDTFSYSEVRAVNFQIEQLEHVKIYPNPAKFDTNLVMTSAVSDNISAELLDSNGRLVSQMELDVKKGFNKINLPLSNFAPGLYLLRLNRNTEVVKQLKLLVVE